MNSGGRPDPVRTRITELTERLRRDAAFRDQVAADPEGTLAAAGLPGEAVAAFIAGDAPASEVAGYLLNPTGGSACDLNTCIWTCGPYTCQNATATTR